MMRNLQRLYDQIEKITDADPEITKGDVIVELRYKGDLLSSITPFLTLRECGAMAEFHAYELDVLPEDIDIELKVSKGAGYIAKEK